MEQQHQEHDHMNQNNHGLKSGIDVSVSYENNILFVFIEDEEKKAPKLVENHEKLMHLIVVSDNLDEFHHLHPVQMDEQNFKANIILKEDKGYKAFVDIMVEDKTYLIRPINVSEGPNIEGDKLPVELDDKPTKQINGIDITLEHSPFIVGQKVDLTFIIKNGTPDPYLGALGHVVIIDEKVENFIHVHPKSDHETIFEAHFDKAGKYKLWAEFKFGNEVVAFPYVFQVDERSKLH